MISVQHSNSILILILITTTTTTTTTCHCLTLFSPPLPTTDALFPFLQPPPPSLPPSQSQIYNIMESQFFDFIKLEKPINIIARFRIPKFRPFFDVFLLLGLISWSSARVPPLLRATATYAVDFSTFLFNHHVIFLIGNAIIVMLFLLCRQNVDAAAGGGDDFFYDEYVKHRHSDAAAAAVPDLPPPVPAVGGDEEKQIVVCRAVEVEVEVGVGASCDCDQEMAVTIEKARRQIKRFERSKSEKLMKREIRATTTTQNGRNSVSSEMERLSSEEFRRTIDAFIHENWSTKKKLHLDEYQKFQMAF